MQHVQGDHNKVLQWLLHSILINVCFTESTFSDHVHECKHSKVEKYKRIHWNKPFQNFATNLPTTSCTLVVHATHVLESFLIKTLGWIILQASRAADTCWHITVSIIWLMLGFEQFRTDLKFFKKSYMYLGLVRPQLHCNNRRIPLDLPKENA